MRVDNISASALLPAELREIARIKRGAVSASGQKISMRDPQLFQKLERILKGFGQNEYSEQLWELEADVSNRLHSDVGSFRIDPDVTEIDEEYLADGSKVTVENHRNCGVRVKYYDHAA